MAQTTYIPGLPPNFHANLPTVSYTEKVVATGVNFLANTPSGGAYKANHPSLPPATVPYRYTGQAA